jgi:NAD(P)-dependent dehydrogenase (short-subunit alcohol dehydrogenase family)
LGSSAEIYRCIAEGARVVIWDVNEDKGQKALAELKQQNLSVDFQKVDVTDFASTGQAAAAVIEQYKRIDILINNAGITRDATLLKMTSEQWEEVIDVNLKGVFNCTKAVAPFGGGNLRKFRADQLCSVKIRDYRYDPGLGKRTGPERDHRKCGCPGIYCHRDDGNDS